MMDVLALQELSVREQEDDANGVGVIIPSTYSWQICRF
jgi:hypothetical protein